MLKHIFSPGWAESISHLCFSFFCYIF